MYSKQYVRKSCFSNRVVDN